MFKNILPVLVLFFLPISVHAATVSSVRCSLSSIAITFDRAVSNGDVTRVRISSGVDAKQRYDLDILPGTVTGSVLTLAPDAAAQANMKKVTPWTAYISVSGKNARGGASCN